MNNGWGGDTSLRCLWGKGTDFSEDAITTNEPHQTYEGSLMGLYGRVLSLLALMEETFEGLTRGSSVGRHTRVLYLVSRHSVLWHLRVQRSYPCVGAGGGHRS